MTHPALENMNYDELTQLIDEATNLRTTKFEGRELDEKRRRLEEEMEAERTGGAAVPRSGAVH